MSQYLLFIDTEASGLPQNWAAPYNVGDNWPYVLQVSWLVFDNEQQKQVAQHNHYISTAGVNISASATQTHGLTPDFLAQNGEPADAVMQLLAADIATYQPMVVGHFMQLDYYLLAAAYYRLNRANPLDDVPLFCTMVATKNLRRTPLNRQLRLDELYFMLFNAPLPHAHNALYDAQATAESFFELSRRGEISAKSIARQNRDFAQLRDPATPPRRGGCMLPFVIFVILVLVIAIYRL